MKEGYKEFKNIGVSAECKLLLDELALKLGLNRGKFVEKLIRDYYEQTMNK